MLITCDEAWFGGWRGPSGLVAEGGRLRWGGPSFRTSAALRSWADEGDVDTAHVPGVVLAPFTDSHVHLGLIDASALVSGGIGRVVDLGWDPASAGTWPSLGADPASGWPEVSVAGPLLTAPGGYPSRSGWAPASAAVEVGDPEGAAPAVTAALDDGASVIKIALNSDAGPVWDDATLDAVVTAGRRAGVPVVAHVQGVGQARRAARAGVTAFAHTPFSELLDDDLVAELARTTAWISTLAIHEGTAAPAYDIAVENLARFAAAGGAVLYGTDLGNGPQPAGLNARELAGLARAGLDLDAVLRALTPGSGEEGYDARLVTWLPRVPAHPTDLGEARIVTLPELLELSE